MVDPPQRHGPYYKWSRAIAGKTLGHRLDENEAELTADGSPTADASAGLDRVVSQMEEVSSAAAEILLRQAGTADRSQRAKR
ncbi:MAG: DUF6788 family protein [Streptosporangiaceae bacterium]